MTGREAIQEFLESTKGTLNWYLSDFTDADMLVRPVPGANHAAWQVGNVIGGDFFLIKDQLPDAVFPELPAGFAELHGSAGAKQEGPEGFLTKDEYLKLFADVRAAVVTALNKLTDADLDRPVTGKLASFAPTLGKLFIAAANHTMMHAGQFTVIRRKLGKPVLM
ncbi:DinB family protein [Zavarzinella formosa]|uniref:DinB family protein n=1 Tax=Zavarzinella formosa TaxID=360055 RepID=UPI0003140119|nr:DinB family protein [Zavarzinella formosa]